MTRKDFKRLAQAARAIRQELGSLTNEQYDLMVDQLALACQDCASKGTKFDYDKFTEACR